jgi:hypothetical protein
MSDLTHRLRGLYVANGTNYVQEAADEIDRLRVTNKMLMDDRAALRETQAKFGQVQHDLLSQIDALREQLALAEAVRASQVAGLTDGLAKLEQDAARYRLIRDELTIERGVSSKGKRKLMAWWTGVEVASGSDEHIDAAIDAALKGEA